MTCADVQVTQSILLHPGWNAVWVEVEPSNNATRAVFAGIPVESVWGYQDRLPSTDFIQDRGEPAWNTASMLMFLPSPNVAAFQNNLAIIQAHSAYLVKLRSTTNVTLSITGSPVFRFDPMRRNVFNLRGLPVDPAAPPTFASYFANSPAHKNQPIYGMDDSGRWVLVNPTSRVLSGQAYWIRSLADTTYLGPMSVTLDRGTALDFGLEASSLGLNLINLSAIPGNFKVLDLSGTASPYSYATGSVTNSYRPLPALLNVTNAPATTSSLGLYARRGAITGASHQTVLSIVTSAGTRFFVELSAATTGSVTGAGSPQSEAIRHAGLWVGSATVNAVSEAHGGVLVTNLVSYPDGSQRPQVQRIGAGITPTPVRGNSGFNLRLLVHVDTNGVSRLLREVVQMWADGTYTNDPATGLLRVATPGHGVLVTDEAVLPQFSGSTIKNGAQVGRRYTSAQFDFATPGGNNYIEMAGPFAMSDDSNTNLVTVTNRIPKDFPTNPFRHKFHPDHQAGFDVTRVIALEFGPKPDSTADPDAGYDAVNGVYHETLIGLHKTNIVVQGTFSLRRIDYTATLNQ